jgi:hypothetical protein
MKFLSRKKSLNVDYNFITALAIWRIFHGQLLPAMAAMHMVSATYSLQRKVSELRRVTQIKLHQQYVHDPSDGANTQLVGLS